MLVATLLRVSHLAPETLALSLEEQHLHMSSGTSLVAALISPELRVIRPVSK